MELFPWLLFVGRMPEETKLNVFYKTPQFIEERIVPKAPDVLNYRTSTNLLLLHHPNDAMVMMTTDPSSFSYMFARGSYHRFIGASLTKYNLRLCIFFNESPCDPVDVVNSIRVFRRPSSISLLKSMPTERWTISASGIRIPRELLVPSSQGHTH